MNTQDMHAEDLPAERLAPLAAKTVETEAAP